MSPRLLKRLVFVGGGHAHQYALSRTAELVRQGIEVTLVSPGRFWYSGMGPGIVSGFYTPADDIVDVGQTVRRGGGRYLEDRAVKIDALGRRVLLERGEPASYDVLSLNVGSEVPLERMPGAAQHGLPVKPIENLASLRERVLGWAAGERPLRMLIGGGGAAGCEVAANLARLLRDRSLAFELVLAAATSRLLPNQPPRAGRIVTELLRRSGVEVRLNSPLACVEEGVARTARGEAMCFDFLVLATGVRPPPLFRDSGLRTAADGALLVNCSLQSVSDPAIFGAGDCVSLEGRPLARVGVYAVRAGPLLYHNLAAYLNGAPLRRFRPQRHVLLILNLADGTGLLLWRGVVWRSRWAFRLKDWLDRRFVRRFQLP